jgi:hypothetical protein
MTRAIAITVTTIDLRITRDRQKAIVVGQKQRARHLKENAISLRVNLDRTLTRPRLRRRAREKVDTFRNDQCSNHGSPS